MPARSEPETELRPVPAPAEQQQAAVDSAPASASDVTIAVSAAPAREGERLVFGLRLSKALERPLMLVYATVDGTARTGTDYEAQSGIVTFDPGVTTAEVRAELIDDDIAEGEEQFGLFLSVDPSLATLSDRQITAIVLDND